MNLLRKLSIVPVAIFALYLFGCNLQNGATQTPSEEEVIVVNTVEDPEPFVVVEEMPTFPGGYEELFRYIVANIVYPEKAKANNVQGRVFVQFVVTSKGNIGTVKILRGVDPELDAEAVRVIQSLPNFTPGRQGGVAVPVWFQVPITFSLGQ